MNEKYYYFAKIKDITTIAQNGIKPSEWSAKAEMNGVNFYVGEEGVLKHIKETSDTLKSVPETREVSIDQYFGDSVCLSLDLNNIEAQIHGTKGICQQTISPERVRVVTVKNLVNDKVANSWKDFAKKILAEKEKIITPYLTQEIEIDDFIKDNPTLQISKFTDNTSLEKRKKENAFTKFFNKIKEKLFLRKQKQIPNNEATNKTNNDFLSSLAQWEKNEKEKEMPRKNTPVRETYKEL